VKLKPEHLQTERIYEGRIVSLRLDRLRMANGREVVQEIVEHGESVTLVALDDEERLLLVKQYRRPTEQVLLEMPSGSIDPGEGPEEAARRELTEETGYRPRKVELLGAMYLAPGWASELTHVLLCSELEPADAEPDQDEECELVKVQATEWNRMIDAGDVIDCKSIAAWRLAENRLQERSAG